MKRLLLPAFALALVASVVVIHNASAGKAGAAPDTTPCAGPLGVGGPVPAGLGPGDLVASSELTDPAYTTSAGYPTGARVWRVLYVSTGIDEHDLQLVCGTVTAPNAGPTVTDGTAKMFAWAHGTVGLEQGCLPSNDPAKHLWGDMNAGIGAISWGSKALLNLHKG